MSSKKDTKIKYSIVMYASNPMKVKKKIISKFKNSANVTLVRSKNGYNVNIVPLAT